MIKMNLEEYYKPNPEYNFFINSYNLFSRANLDEFLEKYDFTVETDKDKIHKTKNALLIYICENLEELYFSIINRLAVALELSLKGIAINKKINIFKINKKYNIIEEVMPDKNTKTMSFSELITIAPFLLADSVSMDNSKNYIEMFHYFNDNRNLFIHFAKREYTINKKKLIENLKLAKEYFDKIIPPLKEEACSKVSKKNEIRK